MSETENKEYVVIGDLPRALDIALKYKKQAKRNKYVAVISTILGVALAITSLSLRSKYSDLEKNLKDVQKTSQNIGYAEGYRECRAKIAEDMYNLGVNPKIKVSDHPSIPACEIPYFYENMFKEERK